MRTMRASWPFALTPGPLAWALAWAVIGALAAGLLAAALSGSVLVAAIAAALCAPLAFFVANRRLRRRARLARQPFPDAWSRVLERHVAFYRQLEPTDRRRFEQEVRAFLEETSVTGPRGAPLDDELRVLVAASAVILVFGRPGYLYPTVRDVIVYPDAFGEDYRIHRHGERLGEVGGQGPIILSARALRAGFADATDGHNVGLHEFAHVLDFDSGASDGVPSLMPWASVGPWVELMRTETERIEEHRSVLRGYGATNEAEFFAVATEAFFERPYELADKHPELYAVLRQVYGQDPATRPRQSLR